MSSSTSEFRVEGHSTIYKERDSVYVFRFVGSKPSRGCPNVHRFTHTLVGDQLHSSAAGVSQAARLILVLMAPGPMPLTRILFGASSCAMLFINIMTTPFELA